MELDLHYPWSSRPPELYRTAFRRVVGIFREEGASNVRFVWSPAGERQAVPYYPGDDVVDFVGVTVLADPTWDASWGSGPQTFDDVFGPRYQMALRFAKPILIAELGVSSSLPQGSWLDAAAASLARYPQVRGVVYYNARNAPNLRLGYRPDWRISEDLYAAFVTKAARSADASPPVRRVLPLGPEPGATVPLPDADLEPVATR
jgi:endoglucanase